MGKKLGQSKWLKELLLFVFLFSIGMEGVWSKVIIVSDIDDTIKMSHVKSPTQMIWNHLVGPAPFPHLLSIYRDLKEHYEKKGEEVVFYYLSASPNFVSVKDWLDANKAPEGTIQQRGLTDLMFYGAESFKFQSLKKFLQEQRPEKGPFKVYMFGDNGQQDPQVYQRILADKELSLPDGQAHAFIRRVSNGPAELSPLNYFTSEKELLSLPPLKKTLKKRTKKDIRLAEERNEVVPYYIQKELNLVDTSCQEDDMGDLDEEDWPFYPRIF